MKKLILSLIALSIITISSCKKEEGATPQIKNGSNKIAVRDLTKYD